jgi:hypothetical protein
VILFPFRYWDRWTDRADGPELAYVASIVDQPGAFWRSAFWNAESAGSPGTEIAVLQRTSPDVPWDADPENTPGSRSCARGCPRASATRSPGSPTAPNGACSCATRPAPGTLRPWLAHGWKQTPRLRMFGTTYLAPHFMLRRVDE